MISKHAPQTAYFPPDGATSGGRAAAVCGGVSSTFGFSARAGRISFCARFGWLGGDGRTFGAGSLATNVSPACEGGFDFVMVSEDGISFVAGAGATVVGSVRSSFGTGKGLGFVSAGVATGVAGNGIFSGSDLAAVISVLGSSRCGAGGGAGFDSIGGSVAGAAA